MRKQLGGHNNNNNITYLGGADIRYRGRRCLIPGYYVSRESLKKRICIYLGRFVLLFKIITFFSSCLSDYLPHTH
jgi:hypothetical protein